MSASSWAGAAQLLSAAAISCCSIHESPTRGVFAVRSRWVGIFLLFPGLCPVLSGLSMPGFGARGWGTHAGPFPATVSLSQSHVSCNRRPAPINSFPLWSARWVRRTQPKYGVGWWKRPECHLVSPGLSHLSQHLRDGCAGSPLSPDRAPQPRCISPAFLHLPGKSWDAGGFLEEGLPVPGRGG